MLLQVCPADVIIVEGILVLHMEEVRDFLNMKIYVDTDDDVRLARRIQRDVQERGRDVTVRAAKAVHGALQLEAADVCTACSVGLAYVELAFTSATLKSS